MRKRGTIFRAVLWTVLATTMVAACTTWQEQSVSPEQLIATKHPSAIRIQRQDGSRVVVNNPRIAFDSLLGVTARGPTGMSLPDISQVAVRRTSVLKTAGLVLGMSAVAFVGLFAAAVAACRSSDRDC